jgi:hypothetical protein
VKKILVGISLMSIFLTSACASQNSPQTKPSISTGSDNSVIPTPSAEPFVYSGETKTSTDLLAELQQQDPTWKESTIRDGSLAEVEFASGNCYLEVFPSFQDAVDKDSGYYGDSFTYFASYAQLGLILNPVGGAKRLDCAKKLPASVWLPDLVEYGQNTSKVFRSSAKNIEQCLKLKAECFRSTELSLPGQSLSSYQKTNPDQLDLLNQNAFCVEYNFPLTGGFSGLNSCDLTIEKAGSDPGLMNSSGLMVTQSGDDLEVLRWAASNSKNYGKYMIFGDGWALILYGSTEKQKQLVLEINEVVKGTLVARY